ncbi:MAG: hypothetical protein LBH85_05525 [Treponema sp.]|jgi:hypothetical protein|nr:hypothetical protein [Treponema sp.]
MLRERSIPVPLLRRILPALIAFLRNDAGVAPPRSLGLTPGFSPRRRLLEESRQMEGYAKWDLNFLEKYFVNTIDEKKY